MNFRIVLRVLFFGCGTALLVLFGAMYFLYTSFMQGLRGKPYRGPVTQPVWNTPLKVNDPAQETPLVAEGLLLVQVEGIAGKPRLTALDIASGTPRWESQFPAAKVVVTAPGVALIREGTDPGSPAHWLDLRTGQEAGGPHPSGTAAWVQATSGRGGIYAALKDQKIVACSPTGAVKWRVPLALNRLAPLRTEGDTLVVSGSLEQEGKTLRHGIYALSTADGRIRARFERAGDVGLSPPLLASNSLYFCTQSGSGYTVHALDAHTGKARWQREMPGPAPGSPRLQAGETLYVCERTRNEGALYQRLNARTGEVLGQCEVKVGDHSALLPAHVGNVLLARGKRPHTLLDEGGNSTWDGWVSAIDLDTGQELWRGPELRQTNVSEPVVGGGRVYLAAQAFTWNGKRYPGTDGVLAYPAPASR